MRTIIPAAYAGSWASVVALLFLGMSGLQSFFGDWGIATGLGQRLCGIGEALYGASGLLAALGALLRRRWALWVCLAFSVSLGITAGLAAVAWGEANLITGIASGGLGFLIGMVLRWGITHRIDGGNRSPSKPDESV